jgi:tRNA G18 (ribose-2'-O)-methylase SpoU
MRAFQWEARDLIALGNEYDGLSDDFVAGASEQLYIAMPDGSAPKPQSSNPIDPTRQRPVRNDGSPSLNVAIAAGIICHAAYGYSKLS